MQAGDVGKVRVFLYARVSMDERGDREQNPEMQMAPLRAEAARRGWEVAEEYVDRISGSEKIRPAFGKLLSDWGGRPGMKLLVWKLDRLARFEMAYESEELYYKLGRRDLEILSLNEPGTTNITTPYDQQIIVFLAFWLAGRERANTQTRTKAGIAAKRKCPNSPTQEHELVGDACRYCGIEKDKIWKGGRPKGSKDSYRREVRYGIKPDISIDNLVKNQ